MNRRLKLSGPPLISTALVLASTLSSIDQPRAQNFWQPTNGPYGGHVWSLVVNSSGHVFAGTNGGVYRSTDNGANWTQPDGLMPFLSVRSFAFDSIGFGYAGTSGGVYLSYPFENGATWHPINGEGLTSTDVYSIATNSSSHIFAGTAGAGVFRSTDYGASWMQTNLAGVNVSDLLINSSGHIFAGDPWGGGLNRSTDNGENWTLLNIGLSPRVTALAINSSGHLFAATENNGVFRSTDNGDNWTQINTGLPFFSAYSLAINSSNGELFAGTHNGLYHSTNNGDSWSPSGLVSPVILSLAINSSSDIFAGMADGSGIFRSTDSGASWTEVNAGLTALSATSLAIDPAGSIFAGTSAPVAYPGRGIFRSSDNGAHWIHTDGLQASAVRSLAFDSNGLGLAGTSDGVYRSDNGAYWYPINTEDLTNTDVLSVAINSNTYFFAGTASGLFRSADFGGSWVHTSLAASYVSSLAINSSGHIFAGEHGGGVNRSTDNGETWTPANIGLSPWVTSLAINSSGHLFAGTDQGDGVFRSTDNGDNWTQINTGLASLYVQSLVSSPSNGELFAGTYDGVYHSTNNGDSWTNTGTGLTNSSVPSLAISASGYIFAGTSGGVFRSTQTITAVWEGHGTIGKGIVLSQNYPNPFNPTTTIRYVLPKREKATLEIFDLIGERVRVLIDEEQSAGEHTLSWDGKDEKGNVVASGLYFCRLRAEGLAETRKMVLLK